MKKGLNRGRKGQFMILAALAVIIMIMTSTTLLSYTSISRVNVTKTEFRETVIEANLNFRRALAIALAQVTKELNLRASVRNYIGYNKLEDYPEAKQKGNETFSKWLNATLIANTGLGFELNYSKPIEYECRWDSYQGYSKVSSNLSLNIREFGFYGWNESVVVALNLTVLGLNEVSENSTSLYFSLNRENQIPVGGLTASFIKLLYQDENGLFREVEPSVIWLMYLGDGRYLAEFENSTNLAIPPSIKLVVQDSRGILVGSFPENGTVLGSLNDAVGPITEDVIAGPNPTGPQGLVTITADINDLATGMSSIAAAEYFIDVIGENGTGTPMMASDGSFNYPLEEVYENINVTGWQHGTYRIYVHGQDSKGNWGNPSSVTLVVSGIPAMHVGNIEMSIVSYWYFWQRCKTVVTIVDDDGSPIEGATVYGEWSGDAIGSVSGDTDNDGQVVFYSPPPYLWMWDVGTYTFTVTDVVLNGWRYNPEMNEETSDSITG